MCNSAACSMKKPYYALLFGPIPYTDYGKNFSPYFCKFLPQRNNPHQNVRTATKHD